MWKEIKGYEGYYEVSNEGRVRSLTRTILDSRGVLRTLSGSEMKLSESTHRDRGGDGYFVVNLRRDHTSNVCPVHRLVAEAFIPNDDNLPTVNHKDGDKHNNHVSNLEWASYADNNIHALEHNLRQPRGNRIAQYSLDGSLVSTYQSTCEAARQTGISRGMISHCLNGRCNKADGFVWKKLSESATTIPQGSTQEDGLPAEAQRPL